MATLLEQSIPDQRRPHPGWFARLGRFSAQRRRPVMLVWLLVALVAAPLAVTVNGALSGAGWEAQGSIAQQVRDELRNDFPQVGAEAAVVVIQQPRPVSEDTAALTAVLAALQGSPGVAGVADPLALPAESGLVSADGRSVLVPVSLDAATDAELPESAGAVIATIGSLTLAEGARAEVTGEWPVWSDFNASNEAALHKAELFSGLPTMLLLFLAFGTAIAAGLPLLLALAGISVGFATLHLATAVTPMSVWSMNFSMMIGLAVGIDYSLFIVTRYREERGEGRAPAEAIAATLDTAGKAVFLSALTVVLSLAAVFLVPVMVFRSMALGMILAVAAVAAASLTLLPAVLVALGDRVVVGRSGTKASTVPQHGGGGRWARWSGLALRRPGITLVVGLALLLGLAAPVLGMDLGMPGARVVDEGRSSRDGYELLVQTFGPGAAAPLFVTLQPGEVDAALQVARADPNVMQAQLVAQPETADAAGARSVLRITPRTAVDEPATADLVGRCEAAWPWPPRAPWSVDRPPRTTTSPGRSPARLRWPSP